MERKLRAAGVSRSPYRPRFAVVVLLGVCSGCGSRSGLDLGAASPDDAGPGQPYACTLGGAPHAPCSSWNVAGPDRIFAAVPDMGISSDTDSLRAAVRTGCGALVGWTRTNYASAEAWALSRYTLAASFDGTAADPMPHPSLAVPGAAGNGQILLAPAGGAVAALVSDVAPPACNFVLLDASGRERTPVRTLPDPAGMWGCEAFASGPQGFSYLAVQGANATPTTLVTFDASGAVLSSQSLGDSPGRMLLGRFARADGTFLLVTASNLPTPVAPYTTWLQEFDAQGRALSSPFATTATNVVAAGDTPQGALVAWPGPWPGTGGAFFAPIDPTGASAGPAQFQPLDLPVLVRELDPLPNGDVLVVMLAPDIASTGPGYVGQIVYLQERAPDGTARGPVSSFSIRQANEEQAEITAVPSPDGSRVLLVYADRGIHTLPIACAE
jgi:hypothetical protein